MPRKSQIALGALLLFALVGPTRQLGLFGSAQRLLATWISSYGPWAALAYIGLVALTVATPLTAIPLNIAAAMAFGPFLGAAYSLLGAEIGAIAAFLAARAFAWDWVVSRVMGRYPACSDCTQGTLTKLVFFTRALPFFSFTVVSYGAGLTAISLYRYAAATFLGLAPRTLLLTFFVRSLQGGEPPQIALAGAAIAMSFFVNHWVKQAGWKVLL